MSTKDVELQTRLRHPNLPELVLPWWPDEISRDLSVNVVSEMERPGRMPLATVIGKTLPGYSVGYTVRHKSLNDNVTDHIDLLEKYADAKAPITLLTGTYPRGVFRIDACNIVEIEHAEKGRPSSIDVSMTLKLATDAEIKIGPIIRGRLKNAAKKVKKGKPKGKNKGAKDKRN